MKLLPAVFVAKWTDRFADNDTFQISEADFREFATDIADTFGLTVANVPYYQPGTVYAANSLVRYIIPNQSESFFYSKHAGALPAPVAGADANWRVVPGPVPATQLAQFITLFEAQGIHGAGVVMGRRYGVTGKWNGGQTEELVMLDGFENYFRKRGTLLHDDGTQLAVDVDIIQETYVAAGNGNGGGGTSYTDAQAAAAAAASLVAGNGQHEGVQVSVVNGMPKLKVLYGLVEVLRFKMPAPGSGNLGNTSDDRPAGTSGSYRLTSAPNVAHIQIAKAGPSTVYDGDVASFPNAGVPLEQLTHYDFTEVV